MRFAAATCESRLTTEITLHPVALATCTNIKPMGPPPMTVTVSPLTAAVLGGVDRRHAGVASAVNNVAARLAGLLGIAIIPAVAGIDTGGGLVRSLDTGYPMALRISAAICAAGGAIAWWFVRSSASVRAIIHPHQLQACHDACVEAA